MKNFINKHCKVLLITILLFTTLMNLYGCAQIGQKKVITSVESMTLSFQSYHEGRTVYELTQENGKTELRYYGDVYTEEGFVLEPQKSVVVDTNEFIELMNSCGVLKWDGFNGKYPHNVSDAGSFSFEATVNGGQTINAHGYIKKPKGYSEFFAEIIRMLNETEEISVE
ncbi:MAG: hypothetical protein IJD93_02455 [Ruminococcus sp.]|nr:hypothetical protein [Ruminococcus sp.]